MTNLKYLSVRLGDDADEPIEIVAALPSGTIRVIPLTVDKALTAASDLARFARVALNDGTRRR